MFMAWQLFAYYPDLADENLKSALAVVHQRYSTNTFPNWQLAQPFRCIAHNGEINTLSGNRNHMQAREAKMSSDKFGQGMNDVFPVLPVEGSDSACFDSAIELLVRSGRSLPHAMMMMIPEAFGQSYHISTDKRAFYEYHASVMEPWDGPAAMIFTDGRIIGGTLDRNGLTTLPLSGYDRWSCDYGKRSGSCGISTGKNPAKRAIASGAYVPRRYRRRANHQ